MKKVFLLICIMLFSITMTFAVPKPSIDGHAVVADEGAMPRGLFAKTAGYLPGDSVSVTNPATGITINILVLGSIDPSEGVAILLSPEAAEKLKIRKGSNIQVKITKRVGDLDESVNGSAVLTDDSSESSLAEEEKPVVAVSDVDDTEKSSDMEKVAESSVEEEKSVEEIASSVEDVAEEESVSEVSSVEVPSESPIEETVRSEEEEKPSVEESFMEENPVIAVAPAETLIEENPVAAPDVDDTEESFETEVIKENEDVIASAPVAKEEEPKDVIIESDSVSDEPEVVLIDEEISGVMDDEPYRPIILVPVNPNPPEYTVIDASKMVAEEKSVEKAEEEKKETTIEETPEEEIKEEKEIEDVIVLAPVPVETAYEKEEVKKESVKVSATEKVEEPKKIEEKRVEIPLTFEQKIEKLLVSSVKALKTGYYVQVASLADKENINNMIETYGSKYPLVLVPSSVKNCYQVMVGPLSLDEYGTVLERFKSRGYKDAFMRKIK